MVRGISMATCAVAGLWCLFALADGCQWTRPVWETLMPESVLPRRQSPGELAAIRVEARIAQLDQDVGSTIRAREAVADRRQELLAQLREPLHLAVSGRLAGAEHLMRDSPIVAALVRAIDAEDAREADLSAKLADLRSQRERLEARRIVLRNGGDLLDVQEAVRPSDQLQWHAGDTAQRYEKILREAMGL